jgi:pimeloyl-ACP methyl ester carboxylesterase
MSDFKFFEKDDVRIRYLDQGAGFPLLAISGGGLQSNMSFWHRMPLNVMDAFKNDFRCIAMDLRNAIPGESSGPIPVYNP